MTTGGGKFRRHPLSDFIFFFFFCCDALLVFITFVDSSTITEGHSNQNP